MLEMLVNKKLLFVLMGIFAGAGVVDKCIVSMELKHLVQAAGDMSKSTHPFMRLVRAKFEHACMVSNTVENVGVFVDKYLYEYKICGLPLHTVRRLEKICAGLCTLTGLTGAFLTYRMYGMGDAVLRIGASGVGLGILVWLVHLTTDEEYCLQMAKNYMVDYLENICLHKYEKANAKERAGRQETEEIMMDHMENRSKGEKRKNEPTREVARNLERATAKLAEATKSGRQYEKYEADEAPEKISAYEQNRNDDQTPAIPPEIEKELPKEEMIRKILQEFMA